MTRDELRARLQKAYQAALRAVDPAAAVRRHLRRAGSRVEVDGRPLPPVDTARIAALGKAALGMARGACEVLGDLVSEGVAVSDHPEPLPEPVQLLLGEHPFPGPGSLAGGEALLHLAHRTGPGELLVVLVSGGGSALAEAPLPGLTLEELAEVQRRLMAAGTPIEELNCVRRHLSQLKDGGLLRAVAGGSVATLLISDVVDAPASAIASGPTLADGSTPGEALAILGARLGVETLPRVRQALERSAAPAVDDTPHVWSVVADGATAASAVLEAGRESGMPARLVTTALRGEARDAAATAVQTAAGGISILTGETTVTGAVSGRGGRNQEAALAAAILIDGRSGWGFAALGTDGIDGPTDAAGAVVDWETVRRGREQGLDPHDHLARHDSYPFLAASGDLVRTGPTGTNVGDVWMVVRPA